MFKETPAKNWLKKTVI